MFPNINPRVSGLSEGFPAPSLPPRYFIPAVSPSNVVQLPCNPHRRSRTTNGAKLAGLRYEKKVKERLRLEFGDDAILAPWFSFTDGTRRCCSPDFLLRRGDDFVIGEIKIRHVADSWWQLKRLYLPVMQAWRPASSFRLLTIVGSFDPATAYPEDISLIYDIGDLPDNKIGVMRWKL